MLSLASAREGAQSFVGFTDRWPINVLLAPFLLALRGRKQKILINRIFEIIVKIFEYLLLIISLSFIVVIIEELIEDNQANKKLRERWQNDRKQNGK